MNAFDRIVFLDYISRNLSSGNVASEISSAAFLSFGYHKNYKVCPPMNNKVSYDLAPNIDDDGQAALAVLQSTIIPALLQGQQSGQNHALFAFDLSEDGYPYGARESSILSMQNPSPHIFEISLYPPDPNGFFVTKNTPEKLQVALYDSSGLPITLQRMLTQTTLTTPAPAPQVTAPAQNSCKKI